VAATGLLSNVRVTASSTLASVMLRGVPGRESSAHPSIPCNLYLSLHFPAVEPVTPNCRAISRLLTPSAARSTIFDRMATRWAVLGLRANRVSFSLSAGSTVHGCFGRPVLISPPDYPNPG